MNIEKDNSLKKISKSNKNVMSLPEPQQSEIYSHSIQWKYPWRSKLKWIPTSAAQLHSLSG